MEILHIRLVLNLNANTWTWKCAHTQFHCLKVSCRKECWSSKQIKVSTAQRLHISFNIEFKSTHDNQVFIIHEHGKIQILLNGIRYPCCVFSLQNIFNGHRIMNVAKLQSQCVLFSHLTFNTKPSFLSYNEVKLNMFVWVWYSLAMPNSSSAWKLRAQQQQSTNSDGQWLITFRSKSSHWHTKQPSISPQVPDQMKTNTSNHPWWECMFFPFIWIWIWFSNRGGNSIRTHMFNVYIVSSHIPNSNTFNNMAYLEQCLVLNIFSEYH